MIICNNCGKVNPSSYKIVEDGVLLCEECAKPAEYMGIEDCKTCKFFDLEKSFCEEPNVMEEIKLSDKFVCGKIVKKE